MPRPISRNAGKHVHVGVVDGDSRQQPEAEGDESHAGEDDRLGPDQVVQHARERSDDQ